MKILIIGGTGTVGKKIVDYYSLDHEVLVASRSKSDLLVDISNSRSIQKLFDQIGKIDAIICAAGEAKWGVFSDLTEDDFYTGIKSKLMGQVNIVRIGKEYLSQNGSITLTTGILADDPVVKTTSAAMVNGGIHSFVKAAALEMENGIRLNVVSSGVVEDAYAKYKTYFPGHTPISMDNMMRGYIRSVEGKGNGQIIRIYD